jgi:glycerol-3-phosphate dehydrogenase
VTDVLERRARANFFAADNGLGAVESVASTLAGRMGWTDEETDQEIRLYQARIREDLAWRQE